MSNEVIAYEDGPPIIVQPPAPAQHATFAAALAAAQGEMANPVKTLTAKVTSKRTGQTFEYRYADLAATRDAVIPALSRHGIACVQDIRTDVAASTVTVAVALLWQTDRIDFCAVTLATDLRDPQAFGTTTTYARRYTLGAVSGTAPEFDDDGESAAIGAPARPTAAPSRPNGGYGHDSGQARPGSTPAPRPPTSPMATPRAQERLFARLGAIPGPALPGTATTRPDGTPVTWTDIVRACHDAARGGAQIPGNLLDATTDLLDERDARMAAERGAEAAAAGRPASGVRLGKAKTPIEEMDDNSLMYWQGQIAGKLDDPRWGAKNALDLKAVEAEIEYRRGGYVAAPAAAEPEPYPEYDDATQAEIGYGPDGEPLPF